MKFSTALALSAAPLAMAKAVHNAYPAKRDSELAPRSPSPGGDKSSSSEISGLDLSGLGLTSHSSVEVIIIWVNPGNNEPTTTLNTPPAALAAPTPAAAAPAAAVTHNVMVGGAAGLVYVPSEVQAAVGDMVVFTFMSANHTVTQSAFEEPCKAIEGGMDSGFQPNPNDTVSPPPQVAMQVMVDTPLWFYCQQKGHCGKGMAFSINPTAAKTQAMFQAMAIAQNGAGMATAITGGAANNNTGAAAAAPPAAPPAAPEGGASAAGATMGTGSVSGGVCSCAVTCSFGALPAADAQGLGAFGGMTGSLPMAMSEPVMNGF
ncbi:unnamed protein product [Discula destructiva]